MPRRLIAPTRIGVAAALLLISACVPGVRDTARAERDAASSKAERDAASIAPAGPVVQPGADSGRNVRFVLPRPVGFVNDFAGVISDTTKRALEDSVQRVRQRTGGEIALVTIRDLAGFTPDSLARRFGMEWGVGAKTGPARNAGVVVLIVPKESSSDGRGYCRIELGTGAAAFISDSVATSICVSATPAFRLRDYDGGLRTIALDLARRYSARFGPR